MQWSEFLSRFNFHLEVIKGTTNARADALSRRPGDEPVDTGEDGAYHQRVLFSTPDAQIAAGGLWDTDSEISDDEDLERGLRALKSPARVSS